jgi:acyl carrier protein
MSRDEVYRQLITLGTAALDRATLPDGPLDEHLDSVQRLTLVVAVEDHFGICFEPEDDEEARTLDDVVRIVQRHLEATHG